MASDNSKKYRDYFASPENDSECATAGVLERIKDYRNALRYTGLYSKIVRSWNAYFGNGPNGDAAGSAIQTAGVQGETLRMTINRYGALANQTVTLATSSKPTVKAIAANNDYKSMAQAKFAESLNDYYDRELAISDVEKETARNMVLFGEGWEIEEWDQSIGEPFMRDENGKVLTTGDVRVFACTPFDVARDAKAQSTDTLNWVAFRRKVSRYDLAAQFPDKKDDILAFRYGDQDGEAKTLLAPWEIMEKDLFDDANDIVYMWEFRHKKTPALPNGRLIRFLSAKVVLFDTVEEIPAHMEEVPEVVNPATGAVVSPASQEWVERALDDHGYPYGSSLFAFSAAPERIAGTSLGHTQFFDLLSMQEGVDMMASITASSISAGGLQNLYVKRGENISAHKLAGGLNVIEYDDAIPEAKANVAIPKEVSMFSDSLKEDMQSRVSLNSVTAGTPSAGMPAQAMALLRAQAVEFHSGLQEAYERLVQRSRSGIIELLQVFAQTERVAEIAGKSNTWALKEFTSKDIEGFKRFVVEPVNPAVKTLAGKVSFAQPLLSGGVITPQQYLQIFDTGRLDSILDPAANTEARVEREKELLMDGIGLPPFKKDPATGQTLVDEMGMPMFTEESATGTYVRPLIFDDLAASIKAYQSVLNTPSSRSNPKVVSAVLAVIQYCMMLYKNQPPTFTALNRSSAYIPGPSDQSAPAQVPQPTVPNAPAPNIQPAVPQAVEPEIRPAQPPQLKNADKGLSEAAAGDTVLGPAQQP